MYNGFFTKKKLFFKNRELRNYRQPSVDNIFRIILTFNSDFLGYRRIQHVQWLFQEKNTEKKVLGAREYLGYSK